MSIFTKIKGAFKAENADTLKTSHVFCVMPWVHFHVTQYGTVTPCCQAPWQEELAFGNINTQSINDIWNNHHIKEFRKNLLTGQADKRCEYCYIKEKSGYTSLRQISNDKYKHKFEETLNSKKNNYEVNTPPVYFDIRFSNVCNLKCRICGPWSSSSWYNDAVSLGWIDKSKPALTNSIQDVKAFFNQFEKLIDSLEELCFAGGEPLVTEEHYQILELLIKKNKTDVQLTYNTNFSSLKYKNYDLVSLWKQFPNISLAVSLDASNERGELLRKNLVWKEVVKNRLILKNECPHIELIVSPTLNVYNLMHLPDFHVEWVNQQYIQVEDFIPTLLVKPNELSILSIPDSYRTEALEKYKMHFQWILKQSSKHEKKRKHMIQQFENIIETLSRPSTKVLTHDFEKNFQSMDAIRQESSLMVFPELKSFVKSK